MENIFADRISDVPRSFIREILKVTADPDIISFAGGLPNRDYFPVKEIKEACVKVLDSDGKTALQYSTSEGYPPLRAFIAKRYRDRQGIDIDPDEIIITNGSQQGLDLIGKTLLNEGSHIGIENPGYLGAIQAFAVYKSVFHPVTLREDGIDVDELGDALKSFPIKVFYGVPNFQNPTGATYSVETRKEIAEVMGRHSAFFIEDNPYGELRFIGSDVPLVRRYLPDRTILLGSFSKITAPSFRLGWICASRNIMDKMIIAKQASDLHTNYLSQRILSQCLADNDIDRHIAVIREAYGRQRNAMVRMIREHFPEEVRYTEPEGGMFLWITLPAGLSSMELFEIAIGEKVAFVPGIPFYACGGGENTMRLNFSNSDEGLIEEGIRRLGVSIRKMMGRRA
ncbi:MAG TPA: PLP-dependent aminotransferase family protein [Spirochaetota bacterium]|nr:PLP-dependent aminotransferase family protein [Spirochaetota bacterium]HQH97086.1 PLP-dependent aminotransferase family protein [Spirochaetota bacterium]